MARRRTDPVAGRGAVVAWVRDRETVDRATIATAVRYTLEELGLQAPGRSVEVRVPPFGAVQAVDGPTHRRGTPPNVVEMAPDVWLALVIGELDWQEATEDGLMQASGGRADLSAYLPLVPDPT